MTSQGAKRPRTESNEKKCGTEKVITFSEEQMKDIFNWCLDNTQIKKPIKKPSKKNPQNTLLHYATEKGYKSLLEVILGRDEFDVDAVGEFCESPLVIAIKNGNKEIVALLLEKGADKASYDPLHVASKFGQDEIIELLIEKGANINAVDINNSTPLHTAILEKQYKTAAFLIQKGASPNSKTNTGDTPLHLVSIQCHNANNQDVELAKLLIQKGAEIDATNNSLFHLLYCFFYFREIINIILQISAK